MSILIKGIEMPEEHTLYTLTIFPNGYAAIYDAKDSFIGETKAVPIPPHGRLIDADEYRNEFMNAVYDELNDDSDWNRANRIIDAFDDAPTIIPAEEGKNTNTWPEYRT